MATLNWSHIFKPSRAKKKSIFWGARKIKTFGLPLGVKPWKGYLAFCFALPRINAWRHCLVPAQSNSASTALCTKHVKYDYSFIAFIFVNPKQTDHLIGGK